MASHEICLWIDERWYNAIQNHLSLDGGIEKELERYLESLTHQLPEEVYSSIHAEIREEDKRNAEELQAARKYSAFHIVEGGDDRYFAVANALELHHIALWLRKLTLRSITPSILSAESRER